MYYTDLDSEGYDSIDDHLWSSDDEGSWYTMDEEDEGYCDAPSSKRPRLDSSNDGDGEDEDEEWCSDSEDEGISGDSDDDDKHNNKNRSLPSRNPHHKKGPKKKKYVYRDCGDTDLLGFIMNIARSIVRLRNT